MDTGIANSINNVVIRLTNERWHHVVLNHPELKYLKQSILHTIENPIFVVHGNLSAIMAVRKYNTKFLVVVYKEELRTKDGFVITAFLTSNLKKITKRPLIWKGKK